MERSDEHFEIVEVDARLVRPLRHEVLRHGRPFNSTIFDGDEHRRARHVAALPVGGDGSERDHVDADPSRIVSVGSVYPDSPPWEPTQAGAWRIRGMATKEEMRGLGLGRLVLDALVAHASESNGQIIWCHARIGALDFYRSAGFDETGEVFDDGVALHKSMWRRLDQPPPSTAST